ncbi:hypothetical protein H5410_052536 [Solanum commersonii]|uniref:Uncharacterized protein n=1 Tax=Solanum commersonii TaxID=4109 RepID=A0A9J5X3B1_SOLCO|nr:hypothetical protein H5410_052536 [Solanum commersonii]
MDVGVQEFGYSNKEIWWLLPSSPVGRTTGQYRSSDDVASYRSLCDFSWELMIQQTKIYL